MRHLILAVSAVSTAVGLLATIQADPHGRGGCGFHGGPGTRKADRECASCRG